MKKFLLLYILIAGTYNGFSQTQITLTFNGKDSVTQENIIIQSVYIKNLDEQCDTILYGPNPVFVMTGYWPLGISQAGQGATESFILSQNFPNPFAGSTYFTIYKKQVGTLNIVLYNGSGARIAEYNNQIDKGSHSFRISYSGNEVLFLSASDGKNISTLKIISNGQSPENNSIQYLGLVSQIQKNMPLATTGGFVYYLGDTLMLTAYASGYNDNTIFDSPVENTDYMFTMVPGSNVLPTVMTMDVIDITRTTAVGGGTVLSDGGTPVVMRGICWNSSPSPTTGDYSTVDGGGTGNFTSYMSGLVPNTPYYVRAYATNSLGTSYGNEVTFTTDNYSVPELITTNVTDITQTTATTGGTVISDGGLNVTLRGVCWSIYPNPTTSGFSTDNGFGTGGFTSYLIGLAPNTVYYVRAYATNSMGTGYGNEKMFTTLPAVAPIVSTDTVVDIAPTFASVNATVISVGGDPVTARGTCWSTSHNPSTGGNHTNDGGGPGFFQSQLSNLSANTLYYVRAYATNSVGTSYGEELSFYTTPPGSHYVGESFGGGIVFYVDINGQHGLISTTSDQSTGAEWGCEGVTIGQTSFAIGSGQANTTAIISGCNTPGIAARICNDLVLNGYSDWFLPSAMEFQQMVLHQELIGGITIYQDYWTSSEYDAIYANSTTFPWGDETTQQKHVLCRVRAIRSF